MRRYGPWAVLGIDPTADQTEIRRVYARLLKGTHPEDDPEGFQKLRAAYESALRDAHWIRVDAEEEAAEADDEGTVDEPVSVEAAEEVSADEPERKIRVAPALKGPVKVRQAAIPTLMSTAEPAPAHPDLQAMVDEENAHIELIQALGDAVHDPDADPGLRIAALEAVLASPAMQNMAVAERTEGFVSHLIAEAAPRGDELIERAIAYFHWDSTRVGGWREVAQPVLQRREDLDRLMRLRHSHTPEAEAFRALRRKPSWWTILRWRLNPALDRKVREFLWITRQQNPGVIADLDQAAVAWWEDYFARPRIGGLALVSLAVAVGLAIPAGLTALAGLGPETRLFLVLGAMPLTLAVALIGKHYVVDVPRQMLAQRMNWSYPLWLRAGWAPAAAVPVLLAAVIPASLPATIALGALAALPLLWSLIAAEPDREDEGENGWESWSYMSLFTLGFWLTQWAWRPNMRYDWKIRVAFGFGYLGLFFWSAWSRLPETQWGQMAAPLLAAAFATSLGLGTLIDLWRHDTSPKLRLGAHTASVLVCLLAVGLTLARPFELFGPLAVAIATLPILFHKAPAKDLTEGGRTWRDIAMRYGWIGWFIIGAIAVGNSEDLATELRFLILWAVSGTVVTSAACLIRDYAPKKARQQHRPVWDR